MPSRRTFPPLTQSWWGPPGPRWPGSLPATRTTANSAESHIHMGNVSQPVVSQPEFHCSTTTRPAGLTMTEQEVDELIAVGRSEDGSRRRALRPKPWDRCPPPSCSSAAKCAETGEPCELLAPRAA